MSYRNPFRKCKGLSAGRIDMGVDYSVTADSPIFFPGRGVVVRCDTAASWPGGVYIAIKFTRGNKKGEIMYFAEKLTPRIGLHAGSKVGTRRKFATFHPGFPNIEVGWAKNDGPVYPPRAIDCYHEGDRTTAGNHMSDFLHNLGAPKGLTLGRPTVC
jgi:hypothetical protein